MCRVRMTINGKTRLYTLTAAAFERFLAAWANRPGLAVLDILDVSEDAKRDYYSVRTAKAA